jgi:fermentation-respiration switch protein FrsA (DUF1100 family)
MADNQTAKPVHRAVILELKRIEESTTYSSQSQFEQAKLWRGINLLFGVPAAVLAAVAGATALASTSGRLAAGIIALVAAGLGAVTTTLNASQRSKEAQDVGNAYLALMSHCRMTRTVELPNASDDAARAALAALRAQHDSINSKATPPSFYAFWRAKRNIERGRETYEVDKIGSGLLNERREPREE